MICLILFYVHIILVLHIFSGDIANFVLYVCLNLDF